MGDTVSELAQKLRPYWLRDTNSSIGALSGSAGSMAAHALNGPYHTGQLAETQAAWAATKSELAAHAALPDAHHAQVHSLVGSDHTASGLTAGHVVRASGATSFAWAQLGHGDLGGVTANQHHNQVHSITGTDHSLTGSKWALVGATADNTLGLITPSASPGAAEAILKSTAAGLLTLPLFAATTKVTSPLIDAAANLAIQPAGDLTIDPTGGEVFIPGNRTIRSSAWTAGLLGTGWGIQERASGKSHLDIRSIYTDELIATTFTADQVRVRSGSDWLGEAMAIAARDNSDAKVTIPNVGGGSVRIYVENAPEIAGQIFDANEYVLVKTIDRSSGLVIRETWGQVSSYSSETGARQSYAWTTISGTGNFTLEPGTALIGFGASAGSYIFRTVIEAGRGPYERFATWATNPYTPANRTSRVEIGDIKNAVGDSTTRYGIAAGNNIALTSTTGFSGFTADNVGGMSIYNADLYLKDAGGTLVALKRTTGLDFKSNTAIPPADYMRQIVWWDSVDSPTFFSGRVYAAYDSITPSNYMIVGSNHAGAIQNRTVVEAKNASYGASVDMWATAASGSEIRLAADRVYVYSSNFKVWDGSLRTVWHEGNLTPGNYALLSGATFTGNVIVNATSGANALKIKGRSDHLGYIEFFQNNGTTLEGAIYGATGRVTVTDSAASDKLSVTTTGVGIGTVLPSALLEVSGTAKFTGVTYHAASSALSAEFSTPSSGNSYGYTNYNFGASRSGYFLWNNSYLELNADAASSIMFSGAYVGIGTSSPYEYLEVAGAISATGGWNANNAQVPATTMGFQSDYGFVQAVDWGVVYKTLALNPSGGNVLVGTTGNTYSAALNVNGNIHSNAAITAEGFLQVKSTTAPATASGWARIFLRSSDSALCVVMPSGNVRVLANN